MAGITFEDYVVTEATYIKNLNYDFEGESSLDSDLRCKISIEDNLNAEVRLECTIGSMVEGNSPFQVKATLMGMFTYNEEESDEIKFENLLSPNAIAILFPYLRTVISNLTSMSNDFPTLNLPVMNIAKMMEDNDLIELVHY
jgi:preprotein translocase subunit SecB